ncbi:MAG TPA: hypothetical protein VMT52_16500, partial [Planctomycetota bacterium]|nr:hypothetical protein [Planctomycetota bacterium]
MVNSRAGPSTLPRGRKTPRSVRLIDGAAGITIRCGGIFVMLAVLGICVFLVHVVVPLFGGASVGEPASFVLPRGAGDLLLAEVNEYRSLGLALYRDGTVHVFDARTGSVIREARAVPEGVVVKAFSRSGEGGHVAFGLEDGSILLGRISFDNSFIDHVPEDGDGSAAGSAALDSLAVGGSVPYEGGVAEKTPLGQLRHSTVQVEMQEPVPLGSGTAPVSLVSYSVSDSNEVIVGLSDDGELIFSTISKKQSLLDGVVRVKLRKYSIPYEKLSEPPAHLLLNARGDQLFLVWRDGGMHRYDLRSPDTPILAERTSICPAGATLTSLCFMLGDQSVLVGDSSGGCTAWFRVPAEDPAAYPDGYQMVPVHRMESQGSPITALAVSPRDKTFASGSADGSIWLRHMTSERVLARVTEGGTGGRGIAFLQIAPKADGVLAVLEDGRASVWPYTSPHPETTPGTIFGKVWYEGYEAPVHTWQSSSGTDDFEPKFGLMPLIFGTLKATFYALLFAIPIAILAAIYTSEFLSRSARAVVKPAIELMASLPSVVLGFLAALVFAPLIESWVVSLLAVFFVVPVAMVLASYFWLFLPPQWSARLDGLPKLALSTAVFLAAVLAAFPLGLWLESAFFLGDFRAWLAPPRAGSGAPFWAGLFLLPSLLVTLFAYRRWV